MIQVCQWQGCVNQAEIKAWFPPDLRPDAKGQCMPLKPIVYCWDHYCRVDDLFLLEKAGILEEALIRSA